MNVIGIAWIGVAVDRLDTLLPFCRDVLGLRVEVERPSFVKLATRDGDIVELFRQGGKHPPESFATNQVVAGFLVDDIVAAREELARGGIELLGEIQNGISGYRWSTSERPTARCTSFASIQRVAPRPDPSKAGRWWVSWCCDA